MKFAELRSELLEELERVDYELNQLRLFAAERDEWQDDEDDCLLAAHSAALHALSAVRHVREVLEEGP